MLKDRSLSDILSLDDIAGATTEAAFAKAKAYVNEGRVKRLEISDDLIDITSSVRGSGRETYLVEIDLEISNGKVKDIDGVCSCPVGYNCKHVAATLIAALQQPVLSSPPAASPQATTAQVPTRPAMIESVPKLLDALPHDLTQWLNGLSRIAGDDAYPANISQRIVYILGVTSNSTQSDCLGIAPASVKLLKDGTFADSLAYPNLQNLVAAQAPKFYRSSDLTNLSALRKGASLAWGVNTYPVRDFDLLGQIVATGRAFWQDHQTQALRMGDARPGRIEWAMVNVAGMKPRVVVDGAVAVNAEPPVYIDAKAGLVGPVDLGLEAKVAYHLLNAPTVAPALVAQVSAALGTRLPTGRADLLPAKPVPPLRMDVEVKAVLRLMRGKKTYYGYGRTDPDVAVARLSFHYGDFEVAHQDKRSVLELFDNGRIVEIIRDLKREGALLAKLRASSLQRATAIHYSLEPRFHNDFSLPEAEDWLAFLNQRAPDLRQAGIDIRVDSDFPYQLATISGDFDPSFETSGIDWLELGLGIEVDGRRVDLGPMLAALVKNDAFDPTVFAKRSEKHKTLYLKLEDGRFIGVVAERLLPIILALHQLNFNGLFVSEGKVKVSKAEAALFLGHGGDLTFRGADNLRHFARLWTTGEAEPIVLPDTFKAELRPYQAHGVAWLNLLREAGLGGILADDMGLGKTVQVLALLCHEKARGRLTAPVLIVAPTSLMVNWFNEAARFAPDLKVLILQGADRAQHFDAIPDHDIVLSTYPLIARDQAVLLKKDWYMAILDEAQTIKNAAATTTKLIREIKAQHRYCLTGTPMENHLGELWSLMSFVNPGYLGDRATFTRVWRNPIEKRHDTTRSNALARRAAPFMLRRTKAIVATELPPKTEIVETIALDVKQRDIYDSIRLVMHDKVRAAIADRGLARSHIILLEALMRLRQACCDPRLLKLDDQVERPSAKLERLMEMTEALLSEGRKIIIFSQFTSMLALIQERLEAAAITYSLLTGDTKDRKSAINGFQNGDNSVFLVSLKAGGVGLNLTAADTVILYDPWWNPAVEEQAIDRAYRIGQDKSVFVYRLVAEGTIEGKMAELKARKRALADSVFDQDGGLAAAITEDDVKALFES